VNSIAVDDQNSIYIAGTIEGLARFDEISAGPSHFNRDVFLAKYSNTGTAIFVHTTGGGETDGANDVAIGNNNVIYVAGFYRNFSVTFGATEVQNAGNDDIFLWRIWQ
jgi:hypothetical protein